MGKWGCGEEGQETLEAQQQADRRRDIRNVGSDKTR